MKWKRSHVLILFSLSLGLYVIGDLSLHEMLGRHPLQSEITIVDRHLHSVEQEQIKQSKLSQNQEEKEEVDKALVRKYFVYGAGGALILLIPGLLFLKIFKKRRGSEEEAVEAFVEAAPPKPFRFPHPDWRFVFILASLLLVGTGGLYIKEGIDGERQLSASVQEIELREKQRRIRDQKERVKEEVIRGMLVRDTERRQKGIAFLVLGAFLFAGTLISGLGRPSV